MNEIYFDFKENKYSNMNKWNIVAKQSKIDKKISVEILAGLKWNTIKKKWMTYKENIKTIANVFLKKVKVN